MGADLSSLFSGEKKKKKKVKGERFYKPPDKRLKERFDPEENLNFTSQLDAAIDKVRKSSYLSLVSFPVFNVISPHTSLCVKRYYAAPSHSFVFIFSSTII